MVFGWHPIGALYMFLFSCSLGTLIDMHADNQLADDFVHHHISKFIFTKNRIRRKAVVEFIVINIIPFWQENLDRNENPSCSTSDDILAHFGVFQTFWVVLVNLGRNLI